MLCDCNRDGPLWRCRRCSRVFPASEFAPRADCRPDLGDMVAYPREAKPNFAPEPPPEPAPTHGPGTELKKLLSRVGITASPDCSCNARARLMDERGIEWCEANIDEIVGWLREEASKRGLPFVDMAGRMLVKRAIRNARKADGHRAD
jgi:hypothetical protein